MPDLTEQQAAFYALAETGVWAGIAVAALLCFVLGQYFTKAVF